MNPRQEQEQRPSSQPDRPGQNLPRVQVTKLSSPKLPRSSTSTPTASATPTSTASRRIAIAVDLSDESSYAVKWAVQNYLRPGDAVILLHVHATSVLYGADWGSSPDRSATPSTPFLGAQMQELDIDNFTNTKATILAQPLVEAHLPYKIHVVQDHDMKERLCLEVERLGLSAVIMGSRGFGASRRGGKGRLGSVSDYCVHHCVCPVVVVRSPEEENEEGARGGVWTEKIDDGRDLRPVPEEEQEYHDADDEQKGV